MNTTLNGSQSDTKQGAITLLASVDLTGKENLLLKIVNSGGVAKFALPTAVTDVAPYVCMSGDAAGAEASAEVPSSNENCRVYVDGAVNPGDKLCLSSTNYGRLYAPAASAGALTVMAIAEEVAVDGQLCKVRFIGPWPYTF